jgi:hypothetical protein
MRIVAALMVFVGLALAGCGPVYETQYSYTPPASAEGRVCTTQCENTRSACVRNCDYASQIKKRDCEDDARADARTKYNKYVREQRRNNAPIKYDEDHFLTTYQCSSSSSTSACRNECVQTSNRCWQMCGGKVGSQQVCTAFCDQQGSAGSASSVRYPDGLAASGKEAFRKYLSAPGHKAWVSASDGSYGWRSGQASAAAAEKAATSACQEHADDCQTVVIDDRWME